MNTKQIKDAIRTVFPQGISPAFQRLWFLLMELGHALVNIPRELLRAAGAPESDGRNWADEVARYSTILVVGAITALPWILLLHDLV